MMRPGSRCACVVAAAFTGEPVNLMLPTICAITVVLDLSSLICTILLMSQSNTPNTGDVPKEQREQIERVYQQYRDLIDSVDLKAHRRAAIEYLDENFAFFLTHVLNMG